MRCSLDLLMAYMDDQLPSQVEVRVRHHLARCAACRRQLAELRAVRDLLSAAPAPAPPPGLVETIMGHVRFREAQRVRTRPQLRFWQGAFAGSAAAALVVALWLVGSSLLEREGGAAAAPAVEAALQEHIVYAALLETGAGDWMDWAWAPAGDRP